MTTPRLTTIPRPYAIAFLLAFCSMSYELIFAQQISELAGNAYVWESLAIGFFVIGMGLGSFVFSRVPENHPLKQLKWVEITLGICAVFSPLWIDFLQILYRIYFFDSAPTDWSYLKPVYIFGFASCPLIALIGFLTGSELAILIKNSNKTTTVLAVYNFGVFTSAVLFSSLGNLFAAYQASLVVASINLCVATYLIFCDSERLIKKISVAMILALFPYLALSLGPRMEQLQLQTFYYNRSSFVLPSEGAIQTQEVMGLIPWLSAAGQREDVLRIRSKYQVIDVTNDFSNGEHSGQHHSKHDGKQMHINGRFQVSSATSTAYHLPFVVAPTKLFTTKLVGKGAMKKVLILGGGDGLTAHELLQATGADITIIEIDEQVTKIANENYWLNSINFDSLTKARVKVITADAFALLRMNKHLYDAIYIDITYPFDFDSSRFYSYEFLRLIKKNLGENGYFAVGLPAELQAGAEFHTTVYSTLTKAGFSNVWHYQANGNSFLTAATQPQTSKPKEADLEGLQVEFGRLQGEYQESAVHSLFNPKFFGLGDPFF